MKSRLMRFVKIVVIAEVIYLVLVNAALNLPLTQTAVNRFKPDKFNVSWERAWSIYPFRVHARGIAANGQSRSQQWQAQAPSANASISLLPLLWRSVSVHNIEVQDVDYRQRPRPRADSGHGKIRAYFPPIEGRELETAPVIHPPRKKRKKPWDISVDNLLARGRHSVWLYQMQGKLEGELRADLTFQTCGGPFSLSNGEVDVALRSQILNGDREVTREGHISGKVEFLPFVPRENKGIKSLAFLNVNAEVRTATESLDFLNIYLANFEGMKVDGAGLLQGRLHLRQGELQTGSDVRVAARELSLDLFDTRLEGDGNISIKASDKAEKTDVVIEFASLDVFDSVRNVRLFGGDGLVVQARGNRSVPPVDDRRFKASRLAVTIPAVEVPDLRAYQAYIPDKWKFRLYGGKGKLQGTAVLTQTGFNANLRLSSEAADIGIDEYRFSSNLELALKLDSPTIASGVDVSGTYVHLHGARLINEVQQSTEPWQASVDIVKGKVKLKTDGLSARVDDQQVTGELTAEITLIDGVPENMDFDISGSSITLDNVRIAGAEATHDDEDWSARFELKKGRALWKRPVRLQVEADLQMTNSKPIVAVIANQRGKHGWLEKALTIDDVDGEARMNMAQQRIVIPYAFAGSDKIDVGAKGVISADARDGVLYVRFRKLHGMLKIKNGKRNLDVFKAREKFDSYGTATPAP